MRVLKESFNAGEFTPKLHSRYELAKYKNGCRELTNFVPLPHGSIARRPGTEYIADTKSNWRHSRLVPFVFSSDDAYIIEMGHLYARFYRNGGQIQTGSSNEKLLLHFDGSDRSTTITDDGNTGHTVTAEGGARLSAGTKKFGTASCRFDGDGDYLSISDHADFNFAGGAFTIDCWVRFRSTDDSAVFYSQRDDGDNRIRLRWDSGNTLSFEAENAGDMVVDLEASWEPDEDKWYHIAVVRGWASDSDKFALCVNGEALDTENYDVTGTMPDLAAICHTTCYWLDTLWEIGEVYEGDIPPNKHFNETGIKSADLPPPNPGSDRRSNAQLREELKRFGFDAPGPWSRKKVWAKLQEMENAAVQDSQTAENEPSHATPCGFMAKTSTGAAAHARQCQQCKAIMRESDGDSS